MAAYVLNAIKSKGRMVRYMATAGSAFGDHIIHMWANYYFQLEKKPERLLEATKLLACLFVEGDGIQLLVDLGEGRKTRRGSTGPVVNTSNAAKELRCQDCRNLVFGAFWEGGQISLHNSTSKDQGRCNQCRWFQKDILVNPAVFDSFVEKVRQIQGEKTLRALCAIESKDPSPVWLINGQFLFPTHGKPAPALSKPITGNLGRTRAEQITGTATRHPVHQGIQNFGAVRPQVIGAVVPEHPQRPSLQRVPQVERALPSKTTVRSPITYVEPPKPSNYNEEFQVCCPYAVTNGKECPKGCGMVRPIVSCPSSTLNLADIYRF
jgi:hypothetical protein